MGRKKYHQARHVLCVYITPEPPIIVGISERGDFGDKIVL
jgi:hypothetical protein